MNDEISQIRQLAKNHYEHSLTKANLKQRMELRLTVSYNSGLFKVTPDFIAFLSCFTEEKMVIADSYGTPVQVLREPLLNMAKERYHEIMNEWKDEWDQLRKIRSADNV